ncbi:YbaK/EbsC family protein [Arthrobacter russicus]|uniref:Prolyl-tRNA editing enzyme YbaK/EbsC (Cys-tRNA(Pro) deacylase) n=1 Tax=Arthrobacter russicus TaxID=172040 RepID=A0ABU1J8K2_9MICC|nr:YbaK/EbsC family protein [Arthrobacter russicus]MDR6267771.1 prolyl-tRNA editing enzyme YbaK/EbsC (Cys-tRNA(Pro) deacylase) [Arthrobacter russicus]
MADSPGPGAELPDPVGLVRQALLAAGAEDRIVTLDDGVPTAEAAAKALGCDLGSIANSLIFELAAEPLLIVASGAARVNTGLVATLLGCGKIRRASPAFVFEHTGQHVGGVAPLGHPRPIRTIVDASLAEQPILWAGAGDHLSMFSIEYPELLRITGAQPLQVR